jgi:hypothetical protein
MKWDGIEQVGEESRLPTQKSYYPLRGTNVNSALGCLAAYLVPIVSPCATGVTYQSRTGILVPQRKLEKVHS